MTISSTLLLSLVLVAAQAPAEPPPHEPPSAADPAVEGSPEGAAAAPDLLLDAEESPAPSLFAPAKIEPPAATPSAPAEPAPKPRVEAKPRLLVLDLIDQGAGPIVTGGLSQAMQGQAIQSYAGEVITTAQLKVALDASGLQALSGCMSEQCMTDLGGTVEAERTLGGSIAKAGDDYVLTLLVVENQTGRRVAQQQRKVPAHEDLSYYAVKQLTSLVLTGRSTDPLVPVAITSSQPGAVVIVDGKHVGEAPVTTQLDPGRHEIRVEKSGFVPWKTTTEVQEATPLELHAELIDPGFPLWPFALSAGAVSAAALAGGVWFGLAAQNAFDGGTFFGDPADSYWGHPSPSTDYLKEKHMTVVERAVWADILYGTAAVFGTVALGFFAWELGAAAFTE